MATIASDALGSHRRMRTNKLNLERGGFGNRIGEGRGEKGVCCSAARAVSSSERRADIVGNRAVTDLAIARCTISSQRNGMSGEPARTFGTGRLAWASANAASPSTSAKGAWPVNSAKYVAPSE